MTSKTRVGKTKMTIRQAQSDLIFFQWVLRKSDAYREWVWMMTPKKWVVYNRAYDKWLKCQNDPMPRPRDFA